MDYKNFVKENKNVPLVGSFKPGCGNTHYENKGSLTLYSVIEQARKEHAQKVGK